MKLRAETTEIMDNLSITSLTPFWNLQSTLMHVFGATQTIISLIIISSCSSTLYTLNLSNGAAFSSPSPTLGCLTAQVQEPSLSRVPKQTPATAYVI